MKKLLQYLPLHILACFILGILLEHYNQLQKEKVYILFIATCLLIGLVTFLKNRKFITLIALLLFFLLGIFSSFIKNDSNASNYFENFDNINKTKIFKITKTLKETDYYKKFEADVIQIDNSTTKGKVLLNVTKDSLVSSFYVTDKILCKTNFVAIKKNKNPDQFNYANYLANRQINKQVFLTNSEYIILKNKTFSLNAFFECCKQSIKKKLNSYSFSDEELSIFYALFLGEKQYITQELRSNYSKAGISHILAISGLHVGILIVLFSFILHPINLIKNGSFYKLILSTLLLWLFALFTGFSTSVVRAVTMYSFVAVGISLQRKTPTYFSLITSMLVLLIVNPLSLFDVGFQLSYSAVFAIIWLHPIFKKFYTSNYNIVTYFYNLLTVSLAAQLGVLPLSIYYFNQLPGLFLITNLIAIPSLFLILIFGITTIVCSFIFSIPDILVRLFSNFITTVNTFFNWVANQETFVFQKLYISIFSVIFLYCILISCVLFAKKKSFQNLTFLCFGIICFQLSLIVENYQKSHTREFIIFYKTKKSIIAARNGNTIKSNKKKSFLKEDYTTKSYVNSENIQHFKKVNFKNHFLLNEKKILIIDSLGVYSKLPLKKPIIILQHSPKINLGRMITTLTPELIIADGSNHKSYITHWKKVAQKEKTPFYSVFEKGAFIRKY